MKTKKICRALILVALTVTINQFSSYGQAVNWATGLTTCNSSTNNLFGTSNASAATYQDVLFYSYGNQYMDLQSGTGYLGIGAGFTNPLHLLDVNGGDVNVGSATNTNGYMIGNNPVLYTGGDPTSIFAGEQLPLTNTFAFSQYNTCTGYSAGLNLAVGGLENTVTGAYAGNHLVETSYNSLFGYEAGTLLSTSSGNNGYWNTMMGYKVGEYCVDGTANNFYGKKAGAYCDGIENCIFGSHAG